MQWLAFSLSSSIGRLNSDQVPARFPVQTILMLHHMSRHQLQIRTLVTVAEPQF